SVGISLLHSRAACDEGRSIGSAAVRVREPDGALGKNVTNKPLRHVCYPRLALLEGRRRFASMLLNCKPGGVGVFPQDSRKTVPNNSVYERKRKFSEACEKFPGPLVILTEFYPNLVVNAVACRLLMSASTDGRKSSDQTRQFI
ncbi:MAG TPA: hypothetical protein VFM05_06095, partial [Candidatus Saccharimonadales bacterium]|nr:hypothetical protein [Candidatus Saccharimonadales bacterium]